MSVPNQRIVRIAKRKEFSSNFSRIHNEALQLAMQQLKGEHLKLWLYLIKNKDNYELELSQKALEEWGLKKDSYYRAFDRPEDQRGQISSAERALHHFSNFRIFVLRQSPLFLPGVQAGDGKLDHRLSSRRACGRGEEASS